ncbi:uroporphyrinogen decarboxylase family protein [Sporomusa malonica]|uniref:Uroporphyrinogen decarboxylase n=1 Tax=Sporomusa malonica TaxID=112901 RepID=A0A1W1ZSI6_9FIRM|nr:uroporphyrinogen decarboxylase family protein [Sporomusa malonica]SMC51303.1 uroporphyrinogen decarboxylase [Sporomusa malonica]
MDHITRVESAIKRQPVDRTPCAELVITDDLVQTMFGQEAAQFEHRLEFIETMGLDAVCLHPSYDSRLEGIPCVQDVVFCDLKKWVNTDLFTFAVLDGPVGWGGRLLGFEQLMRKLVRGHDDFLSLMTAVEQMNMSLMNRLAGNGVNGILIADDIAFNQGVIARPAIMRQLLFPSLVRQVEHAKQLGLPVFFHSDGNLELVLEDIAAAGFDGLQCIESLARMDIGAIKEQYGHKLCLWGNLDPAELIEPRSLSELEYTVNQIITAAGNDSGLIFGTSSGLFEKMRLESIKAVYEFARKCNRMSC